MPHAMNRIAMVTLVASLWAIAPAATAAPCAGFSDVDDASPFCESVAWLRNRGATAGCGPGVFCPADALTRLQAAALLQRLTTRVTAPLWVDANGKPVGPLLDGDMGSAYWRSPYGPAILTIHYHPDTNTTHWQQETEIYPYYASSDCTGPAFVPRSPAHVVPVSFYWRGSELRLVRVQPLAPPAPIPGAIYTNGYASISYWSGTKASNACNVASVHASSLFLPLADLANVTHEFQEPFRLE